MPKFPIDKFFYDLGNCLWYLIWHDRYNGFKRKCLGCSFISFLSQSFLFENSSLFVHINDSHRWNAIRHWCEVLFCKFLIVSVIEIKHFGIIAQGALPNWCCRAHKLSRIINEQNRSFSRNLTTKFTFKLLNIWVEEEFDISRTTKWSFERFLCHFLGHQRLILLFNFFCIYAIFISALSIQRLHHLHVDPIQLSVLKSIHNKRWLVITIHFPWTHSKSLGKFCIFHPYDLTFTLKFCYSNRCLLHLFFIIKISHREIINFFIFTFQGFYKIFDCIDLSRFREVRNLIPQRPIILCWSRFNVMQALISP